LIYKILSFDNERFQQPPKNAAADRPDYLKPPPDVKKPDYYCD
jgi:hypothetical protein